MDDEVRESSGESHQSPGSNSSSEHGSISSATSPLSQRSCYSPKEELNGESSPSNEAASFLSDLDNYLPLGCLCFEDLAEFHDDQSTGVWSDITQLPPLLAFEETLYSHLHKLASSGWIRIFSARSYADPRYLIFRIYILPFDVGLRFIDRQSKRLYLALENMIVELDISSDAWNGNYIPESACKFDMWASRDEGSLFWMFNNLPSPSPSVGLVKEKYAREAMEDLLDSEFELPGLKTQLYPYQRRSAGLMLQRESISTLDLDPRLEQRTAPDGSTYYFGARDLAFLRYPRYYEACKGGVLAESMGLGKTVICLALILATKDHPPLVPTPYNLPPTRPSIASLTDMAISAVNRKSVPWRVEFQREKLANHDDLANCRKKLEQNPAAYEIPVEPMRWNRKTILPPPKKMTLASTTIIVVPRNLCKQWQSEIQKHVDADILRILVIEDSKKALPPPDELCSYDIILFTRGRFEIEVKDGADAQGRRLGSTTLQCRCFYIGASRIRDCHCIKRDELYDSPLKHLRFKRLIIDEGHFFSNTNNTAASVANRLITADHRWVVSGTPAKDLLGVEVDMSAAENLWHTPDTKETRDAVMKQRRHFSKKDDTNGAIKSLGSLASNFLKIEPWSDLREWDDYIYRHEDLRRRTFSGFSTCLRRTLERMVVKTQPEDVERDIDLPPLSHEVVRLEPSFYDKLTANLFTLVLTANAVTSERTDMDYLFHKNSQKARTQLISNLRQSAFFWTGFSESDVLASLKSSKGYLAKEGTGCTDSDRTLLTQTLAFADTILESPGWKALSKSHELGLFVDEWPNESAEHWSFDQSKKPLLTGLSQLLDAQKYVNERAQESDPGEGLGGAGIRALAPARYGTVKQEDDENQKVEKPVLTKSGIPTSSIDGEPILKRRLSLTPRGGKSSPKKSMKAYKIVKPQKKRNRPSSKIKQEEASAAGPPSSVDPTSQLTGIHAKDQRFVEDNTICLSADSPFLRSRLVGTTTAKLSYLASQILKFYQHEKILIFYDGDNVAYYIAQMLELLHIKHEIYAKSLAAHLKAEYVVRFDQEAQDRVLLMDVRNAAFGLNLPSASRIYFVNPVCRPNVEAQAIKRAHRIGQTRKVFVETLILKNTIEEKLLERSKRMTRSEHREAIHLEDDGGIREIIQSARILPVAESEKSGYGQMARLEEPQQLWGRPGWRQFSGATVANHGSKTKKRKMVDSQDHEDDTIFEESDHRGDKVTRRTLAYVDCSRADKRTPYEGSDDKPIMSQCGQRPLSDPFMPTMSYHVEEGNRLSGPESSGTYNTADMQKPGGFYGGYDKLPLSHIFNAEKPTNVHTDPPNAELLQEILRRL